MPKTLTLLDENYKEQVYNNGDIPKNLRRKIGTDKDGSIELYFLAYESLERIKKYLNENAVPIITWTPTPNKEFKIGAPTNWSGTYTEDPTKLQKIDFYVESGFRPIGEPNDYLLSSEERTKKFGRAFTQYYAEYFAKKGGNAAAAPGTSNHGFGVAIDIYSLTKGATTGKGKNKTCIQSNVVATIAKWTEGNNRYKGYGEWSDCFQAWLHQHGKDYGWIPRLYPDYKPSTTVIEPWHFEYDYKQDIYLIKNVLKSTPPEELVAEKKKILNLNEADSSWKINPIMKPSQQNIQAGLYENAKQTLSNISKTICDIFNNQ
jgi:hypothetical protein